MFCRHLRGRILRDVKESELGIDSTRSGTILEKMAEDMVDNYEEFSVSRRL